MEWEYIYMNAYFYTPTRKKLDEKTIEAVGDLVGDPLDTRKTRS